MRGIGTMAIETREEAGSEPSFLLSKNIYKRFRCLPSKRHFIFRDRQQTQHTLATSLLLLPLLPYSLLLFWKTEVLNTFQLNKQTKAILSR